MFGAATISAAAGWKMLKPVESAMPLWSEMPETDRMPAVFIGHGTPMSGINPNQWTANWADLGTRLPRPKAILAISAHWLTRGGALVTSSEAPPMNYDMQGFPPELYQIVYPSAGNPEMAKEIAGQLSSKLPVYGDSYWGYDHGTWVVLKYMFPKADIPVIQLSIDYTKPPAFHYELGQALRFLRTKGVLVFASGNFVHNLGMRPGTNNDQPYDWAMEFDREIWSRIQKGDYASVSDFLKLGEAAMAHPTYDHFLPVLYALGLAQEKDEIRTFNDNFQWPAVSMRSLVIA